MTVENMFGKLSFLKRASRSLAKTGFVKALKAYYLRCFSKKSGKFIFQVWARPLDGFGRALGVFWQVCLVTLVDLLELWGGRWEALGALWVALGSF